MALETKQEEIRKLQEKVAMKEDALLKSERMLEEDAMRFDTFLKENDKKAHEAIKKAERETRLKQDRMQEVKKLNQQIQIIQGDMFKHKEALEECLEYKAFLDALTPLQWQDRTADSTAVAGKVMQLPNCVPNDRWNVREEVHEGDAPAGSQDEVVPKEKSMPYFTNPQQLLDVFQALEEENLFLIQTSQETEEALEALRATYGETKGKLALKTTALQGTIKELEAQIGEEKARIDQLEARATQGKEFGLLQQEKVLRRLSDKILEVYRQCGFDATGKPSPRFMLSELEARLEELLAALEAMPPDFVARAEKDKERRRRDRKRQEQQELQSSQQEERNRKALLRSMQAPKRSRGRRAMPRSMPFRGTIKDQVEKIDEETLATLKYLTPE